MHGPKEDESLGKAIEYQKVKAVGHSFIEIQLSIRLADAIGALGKRLWVDWRQKPQFRYTIRRDKHETQGGYQVDDSDDTDRECSDND